MRPNIENRSHFLKFDGNHKYCTGSLCLKKSGLPEIVTLKMKLCDVVRILVEFEILVKVLVLPFRWLLRIE